MKKKNNWTLKDAVEAYKQGWAPFTRDDGSIEIQALDDPDGVAEEFGFSPFSGKRFEGLDRDDEALAYVKKQAKLWVNLALKALALVKASKKKIKNRA